MFEKWYSLQITSFMCFCRQDIEKTTHFALHCPNDHCTRKALFPKINQISSSILGQTDFTITNILLFANGKRNLETSKTLLMSTVEFILLTERCSYPLIK